MIVNLGEEIGNRINGKWALGMLQNKDIVLY